MKAAARAWREAVREQAAVMFEESLPTLQIACEMQGFGEVGAGVAASGDGWWGGGSGDLGYVMIEVWAGGSAFKRSPASWGLGGPSS